MQGWFKLEKFIQTQLKTLPQRFSYKCLDDGYLSIAELHIKFPPDNPIYIFYAYLSVWSYHS